MPIWLQIALPIITLFLGFLLDKIWSYYKDKKDKSKEFEENLSANISVKFIKSKDKIMEQYFFQDIPYYLVVVNKNNFGISGILKITSEIENNKDIFIDHLLSGYKITLAKNSESIINNVFKNNKIRNKYEVTFSEMYNAETIAKALIKNITRNFRYELWVNDKLVSKDIIGSNLN